MIRRKGREQLSELRLHNDTSRASDRKNCLTTALISSKSHRLLLPEQILADKVHDRSMQEKLYEENHRLKQTVNRLEEEASRLKVELHNRDEEIARKLRMIGRCRDSIEIESIFEQDVQGLRRRNRQLEQQLKSVRAELEALEGSFKAIQMVRLQSENSELQETVTKLQVKLELMRKQGESGVANDDRFEQEALNYVAADRIRKLTRKNEQLCRQNSSLRSSIASMRARMREFQQENDMLLAERIELDRLKQQSLRSDCRKQEARDDSSKLVGKQTSEFALKYRKLQFDYRKLNAKYELVEKQLEQACRNTRSECAKQQQNLQHQTKIELEHLTPLKQQLLEIHEVSHAAFEQLAQAIDGTVTREQIVALFENAPFFISNRSHRCLLAQYLIRDSDNKATNPTSYISMKGLFVKFEQLIKALRAQDKENRGKAARELLTFVKLNMAAIQIHCADSEQQAMSSSRKYILSKLLENVADLDIHGKYKEVIEQLRQRSGQPTSITWPQFLEGFKILAKQSITQSGTD